MHEGQKVFFRVSLALFKHFELHLPKPLSLETILYYFKKGLKADIVRSPGVLNSQDIQRFFEISLPGVS